MIRQAVRADLPAVYQLICALEKTAFPEKQFEREFHIMMADLDHMILVAETESRVVGVLHLRMEFQLHHCGKVAEILELVVNAEYRSHGIGKQLLTAAETVAKKNHCQILEVCSNQNRKRAHEFYQQEEMKNTHFKLMKPIAQE